MLSACPELNTFVQILMLQFSDKYAPVFKASFIKKEVASSSPRSFMYLLSSLGNGKKFDKGPVGLFIILFFILFLHFGEFLHLLQFTFQHIFHGFRTDFFQQPLF